MSAPPIVEALGARFAVDGEAVAIVWLGEVCLVATGEAAIARFDGRGAPLGLTENVHHGALLCGALGRDAMITGGDDGRIVAIDAEGGAHERAAFKGGWIDALAATKTHIAAGVGKDAVLMDAAGAVLHRFEHDQRVAGLAFEPNGRRLAAAHYGGATISWASNPASRRKTLEWKGAHLMVGWSPDARFLLTTMQENALHGWRLQDGSHFRMAGYPAKIRSLSFSADGRWLATAGAGEIVCWPFTGATGPVGKEGMVAGMMGAPVTAVACHPTRPVVAAGAADGEVALHPLGQGPKPALVDGPTGAAVTAMAWSAAGGNLAWARADGTGGAMDLRAQL